jgi:hypothetical protein
MTTTSTAGNSSTRSPWAGTVFSFPNPVNEVSARLVAGGVVLMALVTIVFDQPWLTVVLAYGFVARVLSGPTLSPLGQLVTRLISRVSAWRRSTSPAHRSALRRASARSSR